ncbi:MAG: hypothetical protein ACOVLG_04475 [Flavobacterium sp.]
MKPIILFYFLFFSVFSFGQFQSPEAKIILPEIKLPEHNLDYLKPLNKKLKKSIIDRKTKEYDENGNIIKEAVLEDNTTKITTYEYKNNVLIKKETITTSDEEKIKRANERAIQESKRDNDITAIAIQNADNSKNLYLANLDKKNRVIAFSNSYEIKRENGTSYKNITEAEVLYEKGKIIEVKSKDRIEKYYYDKELLLKKETTIIQGESKETKTDECVYDANKNLIVIYQKTSNSFKDKITYNSSFVKDSAVYNSDNLLIWQGDKKRYTTYKYDVNNNVTERFQYQFGKEYVQEEFEYENKQLVKMIRTIYSHKKDKEVEKNTSLITYKSDGTKLKEHYQTDSKTSYEMLITYEYDDQNRLKKIADSRKYSKSNTNINFSETIFNYTPNALQVTNNYGNVKKYEFY